jgi:plastocyanin
VHINLDQESLRGADIVKIVPFLTVLFFLNSGSGLAVTHTVINSGFTFSPSSITINLGDTVRFQLASIHDAVEVSQSTWNAGGTTPLAGGFSVPFGGGIAVPTTIGTHYYVCEVHVSSGMKGTITVNQTTDVQVTNSRIPEMFALEQNYPNPFNPATNFGFRLAGLEFVSLRVYDILGHEVAAVVNEVLPPGEYRVRWNASALPSGVYFYTLHAGDFIETKRLMLLK